MKLAGRAAIVILLVGAVLIVRRPSCMLQVVRADDGEVVYAAPTWAGERFITEYIHSSDRTPVCQVWEVTEHCRIRLVSESYEWYGAGLESMAAREFSLDGNRVIISGYTEEMDEIAFRVAYTVSQRFIMPDREFLLSDVAPAGSRILVRIRRWP